MILGLVSVGGIANLYPKDVYPRWEVLSSHSTMLAGKMTSNRTVKLEQINFPEFFRTRVIDEFECRVFEADCRYDAIIGQDLMAQIGMILDFKDQKVTWDGVSVDMKKWINPSWRMDL